MINPKAMRRVNPQTRLHLKIRLIRTEYGPRPSEQATIDALDFILETGREPDGWKFEVTNWKHPRSSGEGGIDDLRAFRYLINEMRDELQFAFTRR